MAIEVLVTNTNHELFASHTDVKVSVKEVTTDPEVATLSSRASRSFFVERTGDLTVTSGHDYARVSYPRGVPAEAVEAPVEPLTEGGEGGEGGASNEGGEGENASDAQ